MNFWYEFCQWLPIEVLQWRFMQNALLAILLIAPLFGLCSTMIVTGKMSFFSDALGHSAFTGIAIGCVMGIAAPTWVAVTFSVLFSVLFSIVRIKSNHTADTLIGVFSSTAVALGIFVATLGGGSFTKYNRYLIGDILSVTPTEILLLFLLLLLVVLFWTITANRLTVSFIYPQLAASRGIPVNLLQCIFTVLIAVTVTLSISWVGLMILNSLLILPGAASRNLARNLKQYHLFSVLIALISCICGLWVSFAFGASTGAAISLILTVVFVISLALQKWRR